MPDAITKTQRLLDLIAYLVGRRVPVSVEQILENVPAYALPEDADDTARASTRRMFERDKDELRELGIPLETGSNDPMFDDEIGYRIDRRAYALPE